MTRLTLCVLLLAGAACRPSESKSGGEAFRPITVGTAAPVYEVVTMAGDTVRIGGSATGALTLLNVWATWCVPCRKEFPALESLHERHGAAGLRVVGVSIDVAGDDARVRQSATSLGGSFAIARDRDGVVQDAFRTIGVPESFLIGRDGTLLWRHIGDFTPQAPALEAIIERELSRH